MWPFYACTEVTRTHTRTHTHTHTHTNTHTGTPEDFEFRFYVSREQWIVLSYQFVKFLFCFVPFSHVDKNPCNNVSPHEICNKITSGKSKWPALFPLNCAMMTRIFLFIFISFAFFTVQLVSRYEQWADDLSVNRTLTMRRIYVPELSIKLKIIIRVAHDGSHYFSSTNTRPSTYRSGIKFSSSDNIISRRSSSSGASSNSNSSVAVVVQ